MEPAAAATGPEPTKDPPAVDFAALLKRAKKGSLFLSPERLLSQHIASLEKVEFSSTHPEAAAARREADEVRRFIIALCRDSGERPSNELERVAAEQALLLNPEGWGRRQRFLLAGRLADHTDEWSPPPPPPTFLDHGRNAVERTVLEQMYYSVMEIFQHPSTTHQLQDRLSEATYVDDDSVDPADVEAMEERAEELTQRAVVAAIDAQRRLEADWGEDPTDVDRIDAAFATLGARGIICEHNCTETISGLHHGMAERLKREVAAGTLLPEAARGYASYHDQDVHRVLDTGELTFGFSSWCAEEEAAGTPEQTAAIGAAVAEALEQKGLAAYWAGHPDSRVMVAGLAWRRRVPHAEIQELREEAGLGPE